MPRPGGVRRVCAHAKVGLTAASDYVHCPGSCTRRKMHAVTRYATLVNAGEQLSVHATPSQLAKDLGVSRSLVYKWIRLGLPTTRVDGGRIRISVDDCSMWLKERTTSTTDGDAA